MTRLHLSARSVAAKATAGLTQIARRLERRARSRAVINSIRHGEKSGDLALSGSLRGIDLTALLNASQLDHVIQLSVAWGHHDADALRPLYRSRRLDRLESFELSHLKGFGDGDLEQLVDSGLIRQLRSFSLRSCDVTGEGLARLFRSGQLRRLRTLRLEGDFADAPLGLLSAPDIAPRLETLRLDYCSLKASSIIDLAEGTGLPRLKQLSLQSNGFWDEGAIPLVHSSILAGVTRLDLSFNELSDLVCYHLIDGASGPTLDDLQLAGNFLTAEGLGMICTAPEARDISRLNLSVNRRLGDAGASVLGRTPYPASLDSLDLAACSISDSGLEAMLASQRFRSLETLDLSNNPLGNHTASALGKTSFHRLRGLSLNCSLIEDHGARRIAAAEWFGGLEYLGLADTHIERSGVALLTRAAKNAGVSVVVNPRSGTGLRAFFKRRKKEATQAKQEKREMEAATKPPLIARLEQGLDLIDGKLPGVVFLLGAGASRDAGLPLAAEIFADDYLAGLETWFPELDLPELDLRRQVAELDLGDRSLEEAISEAYFGGDTRRWEHLLDLYEQVFLHAETIAGSHARAPGMPDADYYQVFCQLLLDSLWKPTIISFNHDCFIENNLLWNAFDYGTLTQRITDAFPMRSIPKDGDITLLKLHGSFNFCTCPACGQILADRDYLWRNKGLHCPSCGFARIEPCYVPPLRGKDRGPLVESWRDAEKALADAQLLIIVGYSLPSYDEHSRALVETSLRPGTPVLAIDPFRAATEERLGFIDSDARSCVSAKFADTLQAWRLHGLRSYLAACFSSPYRF